MPVKWSLSASSLVFHGFVDVAELNDVIEIDRSPVLGKLVPLVVFAPNTRQDGGRLANDEHAWLDDVQPAAVAQVNAERLEGAILNLMNQVISAHVSTDNSLAT
jgi:hypothetical protein